MGFAKVAPSPGEIAIRMPLIVPRCPSGSPSLRLSLVVLSIGVASHFLLYLDSVVDNLLPAALPFFLSVYKKKEDAELAWELMVSARIYGLAVGCFLAIIISMKSGRKFPVILGTILDVIGVLFTLLTVYIPAGVAAAILGRFINGIGQGIVQTAGSVMLAELPPLRKRGTALASLTMWACVGELAGMLISVEGFLGNATHWHWAMGVPLFLLVPALVILIRAPESPRYLYLNNKESEARKAMLYYQNIADAKLSTEEILNELVELRDSCDENHNGKKHVKKPTNLTELVTDRMRDGQFVRPLLIALFVQSFVHLDDWLWISYSTQIFENSGLQAAPAQIASLLMALPQAGISIALLFCFHHFSRRSLLIVPTIVSSIIGLIAIIGSHYRNILGFSIMSTLPVLASLDLVVAAISGESAYAIVPELFLPDDIILGTAAVGIAQNIFGGILTNFLLTALNSAGTAKVLVPFVLMNIVYAIVNYKYVPETADKTPQ
ncbi:hypothetical protein WR25_12570, partial [Diploscapter pachys]